MRVVRTAGLLCLWALGLVACGRDTTGSGRQYVAPGDGGGSENDGGLYTDGPVDIGPGDAIVLGPDVGPGDVTFSETGPKDFGFPLSDTGVDLGITDAVVPVDLGPTDFGVMPDFGIVDTGTPLPDFGVVDTGTPLPDTGVVDFGVVDTGTPGPDLGLPDTGIFDTGAPDLGMPDSGPGDTGVVDMGVPDAGSCPGNTCGTAIGLRTPVGLQTLSSDTRCGSDDSTASCASGVAPDQVYSFALSNRRRVVARANSVSGGFSPALSVRTTCSSAMSELMCDAGSSGMLASLDDFYDPGTYYLWVDGATNGARGAYQIDFDIDPQDTCIDPVRIDLSTANSVTVRGDTTGASNTFQASCASQSRSPDHVFEVVVGTRSLVSFDVTAASFDPSMHLRTTCVGGVGSPELACDDDTNGLRPSLAEVLEPGTYHLVVDGYSTSSSGTYTLAVRRRMPAITWNFPQTGDRSTNTGFSLSSALDRIVGNRTLPSGSTATHLTFAAQLSQSATCGTANIELWGGGSRLAVTTLSPGDTSFTQTVSLGSALSGSVELEYRMRSNIPSACGAYVFDTSASQVIAY